MELLSKNDLRQLGRGLTPLFLRYQENGAAGAQRYEPVNSSTKRRSLLTLFLSLLERLLRTAEEPRLEAAHRAAVCDTLCGFLEQGSVSPVDDLRSICLSPSLWKRTLNMYLMRSGDAQAKPMRQVLIVLVKLLSMIPEGEVAIFITNETAHRCLSLIYSHEDISSVRAALNIMEFFLSKYKITAFSLIEMASDLSADSHPPEGFRASPTPSGTGPTEAELSKVRNVPEFVAVLMGWMQEADVAPAAGRLIISLFKAYREGIGSADSVTSSPSTVPLWLPPLLEALREQPEVVDNIEHHVLPGLLRLDPTYIEHVVSTLPVKRITEGGIGSASEEELRLCLVVCKVADDLGIALSLGRPYRLHGQTFAGIANGFRGFYRCGCKAPELLLVTTHLS